MDIIIKNNGKNILIKDCPDFKVMEDGTLCGEKKYCDHSFECRQVGYYSEYYQFFDIQGNVVVQDYLCTGQKVLKEDINKDEKAT